MILSTEEKGTDISLSNTMTSDDGPSNSMHQLIIRIFVRIKLLILEKQ